MSEENVEIVRQAVAAIGRGDADAFVALASPDVEWEDSVFWSETPRVYRGRAELREWFNQIFVEPWEGYHLEITEIIEAADDLVLVAGLATARGKDSGVETQMRSWQLTWFADGKPTRRKIFLTRAEALEAAELEE
jgi:ketosteroid isomerase-like protein